MTHIDIAKTYIHAIQSGDQATLATLISPDVVWHQPGANRFSGTRRGIADVGSMLAQMMEISRGTFAITRANQFMVNGDWLPSPTVKPIFSSGVIAAITALIFSKGVNSNALNLYSFGGSTFSKRESLCGM